MMAPMYVWQGDPTLPPGRFRKWLTGFALGGVLAVAACASDADLTPQQQVYSMQLQLDAAVTEIEVYAAQPPCDLDLGVVVACHEPAALDAAVRAAFEADRALDEAELVVRAGGTTPEVSVYVNLARAALAQIALNLAQRSAQ